MRTEKSKSDTWVDKPHMALRNLDCDGPKGDIERKMKAVSEQVAEDDLNLKKMEKRVQDDDRKV